MLGVNSDVVVIYRRLFRYLRPHWLIIAAAVVPAALYAAVNTTLPLLVSGFVGQLQDAAKSASRPWELPVLLAVLFPIRGVMDFLTIYGLAWVGRSVIRDLRNEM